MNKTPIEWVKNPDGTQGYTWNPITGCLNGCEYCYARKLANTRLRTLYIRNFEIALPHENPKVAFNDPFYPRFWEDRLGLPIEHPTPMRPAKRKGIFPCDMSDLFGIGIPPEWTEQVMTTIKLCPYHRFYLLTKQPQNLIKFKFPDNCWVGVTATDADKYWDAWHSLKNIEANVKYISFEPLLLGVAQAEIGIKQAGISWVILGSQTKPYKPPEIEWVQEIVEACDKAGIPVFLKNNLWELLYTNAWDNDIFWANDKATLRQEMPQVEHTIN